MGGENISQISSCIELDIFITITDIFFLQIVIIAFQYILLMRNGQFLLTCAHVKYFSC